MLTLGEKIKDIRTDKKISRRTLGEMIGITDRQILRYEKNEVDIPVQTLKKISAALNYNFLAFVDPGCYLEVPGEEPEKLNTTIAKFDAGSKEYKKYEAYKNARTELKKSAKDLRDSLGDREPYFGKEEDPHDPILWKSLKLDEVDCGRIEERIDVLLSGEKYDPKP